MFVSLVLLISLLFCLFVYLSAATAAAAATAATAAADTTHGRPFHSLVTCFLLLVLYQAHTHIILKMNINNYIFTFYI